MKCILLASTLALCACGSVTNENVGPSVPVVDEPARIPPNGAPPSSAEWSGVWAVFPSEVAVVDLAAFGQDLLVSIQGSAEGLDLGDGPIEPVQSGDLNVGAVLRVASDGHLVWWRKTRFEARIAVDAQSHVFVGEAGLLRVLNAEDGSTVSERMLGDSVWPQRIASSGEGGALLGLAVSGPDFDLPGIPTEVDVPFTALVAADVNGVLTVEATATNSVGLEIGFIGVGQLSGRRLAVLSTVGDTTWQSDAGTETLIGEYVASVFHESGVIEASAVVDASMVNPRATVTAAGDWLFSGGIYDALSVDGQAADYGGSGSEVKGTVLRFTDNGALSSLAKFGEGPLAAAAGLDAMVAVTRTDTVPLQREWCQTGAPPCDEYRVAESEAFNNQVVLVEDGSAAWLAGNYRATPGGDQSASFQLYVMRLEH